jgi:hypothetical protein
MRRKFSTDMRNQWMTHMNLLHKRVKNRRMMQIQKLNHFGLSIQFIQLRIVNRRFFHIIKETMHGTKSNTITLLRNRGMLPHQMVCH